MNPWLMTLAMAAGLSSFVYIAVRRIRLLAKMAPEQRLDRIAERVKLLLRIGFGQSKLIAREREQSSGAMHFFIFWGFIILGQREVILFGEGFVHGFQEYMPLFTSKSFGAYLYTFVYNAFEAIVFCMVGFALWRRISLKPARLTLNAEANLILCMIWGVVLTDLFYDASKFNLIRVWGHKIHYLSHPVFGTEMAWAPFADLLSRAIAPLGEGGNLLLYHGGFWAHIGVILVFLNLLLLTKHAHVITALPNVFLGSIDQPHTPIALLNVEDEKLWETESLGMNRVEQLTWKQGLDLYTCTECGRCYDICPTYVTGKPLTLKWVNDDLRHHLVEESASILKTGASSGKKQLVGSPGTELEFAL